MTATVEVVFTQDQEPITVSTEVELDAILDRVAAASTPDTPPLVALDMPDRGRSMMVGLRGAVGVLNYVDFTAGGASASKGDTTGSATPAYFYCDTWTGLPADAEIPIDLVRRAAREFLGTGHRPTCVSWQAETPA